MWWDTECPLVKNKVIATIIYWTLFQEFWILKQTILNRNITQIFHFRYVVFIQKSNCLTTYVTKFEPNHQFTETALFVSAQPQGLTKSFSPLLLSNAENCRKLKPLFWWTVRITVSTILFPTQLPEVIFCPWGWTICFCESYNIAIYKNPNCCFDLYYLTES